MFFSDLIKARVTKKQRYDIEEIVKLNPAKYGSASHFVRVAVILLLREEIEKHNEELKK